MTSTTTHSDAVSKAIDRWIQAKESVRVQERGLNHAQAEEKNAANDLGKLLVPEKAAPEETFNVWVRLNDLDKLLSIHKGRTSFNDYEITWRV